MIPADDRGFLLGDGLFETVLARDGVLARFAAHMERLRAGCVALGLPAPDPDVLAGAAARALTEAGLGAGRAAVRLTWTAGSGGRGLDRPDGVVPRLIATAAPAPAPTEPARLATARARRNEGSPLARLKSLSYGDNVLARREARLAGADEALMLNNRGEMACAGAANLFWLHGDVLSTPALGCGVLAGVTRATVIAAAPALGLQVREVAAPPEVLAGADALMLTNSLIGVRAVASLDGTPIKVGEVADRLNAAITSW